jgi:hypothetical protein
LTLDTGDNFTGYIFQASSPNLVTLTINPGASVINCEFNEATVTGTLDGGSSINDGVVDSLNFVDGKIIRCGIDNTITLSGISQADFINCHSAVAGGSTPTIDLDGGGSDLTLRGYSGGIKLQNLTSAQNISIDLLSGQIVLDATLTAGNIFCRGVGKLTDNSAGATVSQELVNGLDIAVIEAIIRNKTITDPVTGVMTVYAEDGRQHASLYRPDVSRRGGRSDLPGPGRGT